MRRLALITGGTSGIGLGAAKALGSHCDLALGYEKNEERAREAAALLREACPEARVETLPQTLNGHSDAVALLAEAESRFTRAPEILIHAAGRLHDALLLGSAFEQHEQVIRTHLVAGMALAQAALPAMYRGGFGRILFLSSISARYAKRGQTSYSASKAALEAFARTLALEVSHRGITVNAIAPGLVETPMTVARLDAIHGRARELRREIPAGFVGKPEDVGELIAFLCSEAGRYITGTTITIDGGRSAGDPRS